MTPMTRKHCLLLLCLLLVSTWAYADFVIEDIRVEGLQRISAGTVFNYLPVGVGSTLKEQDYPEIIRSLFKTGFFTDVNLERDGNTLVITVVERPAIAEINISGNKDINTDELKKKLKEIGFAEGQVFDRALLDRVQQELLAQYYSRGKYAIKINTQVRPLERNRVAIDLDISEGKAARIKQINIVGNEAFSEDELLKNFKLSTTGWFSFFTKDDQYSKQKLTADIETLRSYYLDRGYLKFTVESTQVSITPDKQDIYITININEGKPYTIKDIRLTGKTIVPPEELLELVKIKPGDTFSRSKITEATQKISDRLGDKGYAFANVNTVPTLDDANNQVGLTFNVDPGNRVYVRRITFRGNSKTQDEVLRRELRQMEGAPYSTKELNRSKERLQRLRYIESVESETPRVPGTNDQVDVNYTVVERPSGSLIFGVGYGQGAGLLLNASLNQDNFLGTGNTFNLNFNNSRITTNYSIAFNNPYYTIDGVSRGYKLYYTKINANEANLAKYTLDGYGGEINFGFPINEYDTLYTSLGPEHININKNDNTPEEILKYLQDQGSSYNQLRWKTSWTRDSRNRIIFPSQGSLNRLAGEIDVPLSDLHFYKLTFTHHTYVPIINTITFNIGGDIGYGNGYGNTDNLPFFENFYAGGISSVRAYKANTLGPRYKTDNDPSGGNFKTVGNAELSFPPPFLENSNNVRLFTFFDAGNVFSLNSGSGLKDDNMLLHFSTGAGFQWFTPIGPFTVSYGVPLNKGNAKAQPFQFLLGVPF
ncbi:MAG: outer membrane protein assembly factor BamA [Candidatus Competibacteraceae bacterium]